VKYGGLKFIEAAHIKDLLAVLRLLDNPGDEMAWFRVLQLLEGVGPGTARRIMAGLGLRGAGPANAPLDSPPLDSALPVAPGADPLATLLKKPPTVPAVTRLEFGALRQAVADCLGLQTVVSALVPSAAKQSTAAPLSRGISPAAQVQRLRRFYEPIFKRLYDNPAVRLRDLDQLEQIAAGYSSRSAFVTDLTLDPPSSTQDLAGPPLLEEDYLVLSTIHSAKGCEWDVVHIIHAADGMMPSDMATGSAEEIDEERRLFYVAMTRARDALNIYFPLRYYFHPFGRSDRHSYAQLTRFLAEGDLALYERIGPPAEAGADPADADAPAPGTRQAIDRMLSDLWKA
jgi:DNA helicase-2/ATP-dependent DNA helicase PcrA